MSRFALSPCVHTICTNALLFRVLINYPSPHSVAMMSGVSGMEKLSVLSLFLSLLANL